MKIKITTIIILLLVSISAYSASESELIKAYGKLRLGMSKETAQKIMGKPSQSRENVTKKGEFIGYSYTYVIFRYEPGLVNLKHDKLIELFFDKNSNLKWAVPTNINGIKEIGSPAR